MKRPPSGEQFGIAFEDQRATVVEVGASVREYAQGDRPVLDPYDVDSMCDGAHGTPLIPWPNRLAGGRYHFEGVDYQVPLTEPAKRNAIHGFLRWRPWRPARHDPDGVTMAATLFPCAGYPFMLDLTVDYQLSAEGLAVTTTATNAGDRPCPYGCGQHPYLSPGNGTLDDCDVELRAATRILTDERQLPTGTEPVEGTPYDFRARRRVGRLEVDHAYTDLDRDDEGRAWVRLWGADDQCAELWVDETYPYLEIFTGDTLAPHRRRRGLGSEPMSCPPNALQTGQDVIRLDPGASATTRWGARLTP